MDNLGDGFISSDSNDKYDPYVRWSRIGESLEGIELPFIPCRTHLNCYRRWRSTRLDHTWRQYRE
jgi:hypothetical protein